MYKSERVKITLSDSWFDLLVESLLMTMSAESNMIKNGDEAWRGDMERNERLLRNISKYSRYYTSEDGVDMVEIQMFSREASELIWQLLLCCGIFVEPPETGYHYKLCQAEREKYIRQKDRLPQGAARELFDCMRVGYDLLVKNKNGKCYHVDHGRSGDLVKNGSKWEDPEYGFDENVFLEADYRYKIVSWSDEEPLDVHDYLLQEGWMKLVGSDYEFIGQE